MASQWGSFTLADGRNSTPHGHRAIGIVLHSSIGGGGSEGLSVRPRRLCSFAIRAAGGHTEGNGVLVGRRRCPGPIRQQVVAIVATKGAPGPKTWLAYARDLAAWVLFLRGRSLDVTDDPPALKEAIAAYHTDRRMGPTGQATGRVKLELRVRTKHEGALLRCPRADPSSRPPDDRSSGQVTIEICMQSVPRVATGQGW